MLKLVLPKQLFLLTGATIMLSAQTPFAYADTVNQAFDNGVASMAKGDYDSAINEFDEAIGFNSNNAKAYLLRGQCFYNEKNLEMAIADFDRCIKLAPETSDAFLYRGTAHARQGKNDLAVSDYEEAIKLEPKLAEQFFKAPATKEEKPIRAEVISHGNNSELVLTETTHEKKSSSIKSVDDYKEAMQRLYPNGLNQTGSNGH
jgi:tetratricopeptide (TPR) repeat protein